MTTIMVKAHPLTILARRLAVASVALLGLTAALPDAASAGPRDRWHDHDIVRFGHRDFGVWRSGYWHHGWHGGLFGWYWVTGGAWYPYAAPVFPYPDPYVPPTVILQQPPVYVSPPGVVGVPQSAPPPAAAAASNWYYCANPSGYYPYVPNCSVQWQAVPAQPTPQAGPGPAGQNQVSSVGQCQTFQSTVRINGVNRTEIGRSSNSPIGRLPLAAPDLAGTEWITLTPRIVSSASRSRPCARPSDQPGGYGWAG
jgi:hypothetical protein